MSGKSSFDQKGPVKSSTYLHSDGKTLLRDENGSVSIFADFSLKFVGEIWQCPTKTTQNVVSEGQWLVSMTGLVFGQKFTRLISLKGSDFDTKKALLDAVRRGFPGSVRVSQA